MNNTQHHEAVQKAAKAKFRGRKAVAAKSAPRYPDSAEREYKRITNSYIRILNKELASYLPGVMETYRAEQNRGDSRADGRQELETKIREAFMKIAQEMEQKLAKVGLHDLVSKISKMAKANSFKEWKRLVHDTLGINLLNDYYSGNFYEASLRRWVDENVLKIQSIPQNTLGDMKQIILDGFKNGKTPTMVGREIQKKYKLTRRQAQLLARDQLASLNAELTKLQQTDAGVTRYKWSDSDDSRVRECHKSLSGQIFKWEEPPEMWRRSKTKGIIYTGRRCHPGEDYACRCVAIPVFDWDTVDVPMNEKTDAKG